MPRRRPIRLPQTKTLAAVRPNAGLTARITARLQRLVDAMHTVVSRRVLAEYRRNPPAIMAEDATPARDLADMMRLLTRRWESRFNEAAEELAKYFATAIKDRSDAALRDILRRGGISVEWTMTPAMRDILAATIQQQVELIRSIPSEYLGQVQGLVMRSVQTGRDLGPLTKELQHRYQVTRARAALIARHQNNMATASMTRARQVELGIDEALWMHSHAGKEPRPTHLANDGKPYKTAEGWYDPDPKVRRRVLPGELINCLPGWSEVQAADRVTKAYRRWYSGDLTHLITDEGKAIRATPNHPILTPAGWRAIGSLKSGDYVFHVADNVGVAGEHDVNDRVSSIAEVFASLAQSGAGESVLNIALPGDFHGDVRAEGDIDIILAARPLSFGWNARCEQSGQDFRFTETYQPHPGVGPGDHLGIGGWLAASRNMSGSDEPLAPFLAFTRHPDPTGFTPIADLAARSANAFDDYRARNPATHGKAKDARASFMFSAKLVRIVDVKGLPFEGHVYNLETSTGWYIADTTLFHNCRCFSKAIVKGFS